MESNIETIEFFRRRTAAGLEIRKTELKNLETQIKVLKVNQKKLLDLEVALNQLANAMNTQMWCEAYSLIYSDRRIANHLISFDPLSGEAIELVKRDVDTRAEQIISSLTTNLPKALEDRGYQLDSDSKFPNFKIGNGLIQIKIIRKKREAEVGVRNARPYRITSDVSRIIEAVEYETKRLNGEYDIQNLVDQIISTISKLSPEKNAGSDASVSLEEIRLNLGEPLIPKELFAIRLHDIRKKHPKLFILEHTKDIESGFLLPGNLHYVGRISINK